MLWAGSLKKSIGHRGRSYSKNQSLEISIAAETLEGGGGVCAVGAPEVRQKLVNLADEAGARFANIVSPLAYVSPSVSLGVGCIIGAFVAFGPEVRLGNHVFINHNSSIGEEVVLEDFATVSPLTNIARSCTLELGSFVSVGVTIIDRIKIGAWSLIGAGTTVVREVPANTTVVGVPGKVIKTREP